MSNRTSPSSKDNTLINRIEIRAGIALIIIGILIIIYFRFGNIIFDQTHEVNQEAEHSMSGVTTVKLLNSGSDITVHTADYDDIFATYRGIAKTPTKFDIPMLKARQEDDILTIEVDYSRVNIEALEDMAFDVYLPVSYQGRLDILSDTGSISLPPLELSDLSCVTDEGAINTRALAVDTMLLSSRTGAINALLILDTAKPVTIDTVTGAIDSDYEVQKNASHQLLTTSGDITVRSQ